MTRWRDRPKQDGLRDLPNQSRLRLPEVGRRGALCTVEPVGHVGDRPGPGDVVVPDLGRDGDRLALPVGECGIDSSLSGVVLADGVDGYGRLPGEVVENRLQVVRTTDDA